MTDTHRSKYPPCSSYEVASVTFRYRANWKAKTFDVQLEAWLCHQGVAPDEDRDLKAIPMMPERGYSIKSDAISVTTANVWVFCSKPARVMSSVTR